MIKPLVSQYFEEAFPLSDGGGDEQEKPKEGIVAEQLTNASLGEDQTLTPS